MITGFGVSESVKHFYSLNHVEVKDKRVIIQGWGNVAAAAAYYLAEAGAKITGIIDKNGGLINEEGFDFPQIKALFLKKKGNTLTASEMLSFEQVNDRIWDIPSDVFIPAAASRLVSRDQVERLHKAGLEVIASGANVPFADAEIFYGPVMEFADQHLAVIPDFISNCGMARVFAYLMQENVEISDAALFADTSATIYKALQKVVLASPQQRFISREAYRIALQELLPEK